MTRLMMTEESWSFQHSVQCNTSCQFAWRYWTNIANWNDPPARFELDGRFEVGSHLTTTLPDRTFHSIIRHAEPERAATIEMQLPDGVLSSHWDFEDLSENRTLITQRLVLATIDAALVTQAKVLEQTVPAGMNKLVADIERAQQADNARGDSGSA